MSSANSSFLSSITGDGSVSNGKQGSSLLLGSIPSLSAGGKPPLSSGYKKKCHAHSGDDFSGKPSSGGRCHCSKTKCFPSATEVKRLETISLKQEIAIHYYGRLAAKQGWRFDSTYDHKDEAGDPVPFVFDLGFGKVISGIEAAMRSMRVGGVRRVIIPPSQGYQNTMQEPIPPNFFDQQRLFTTIFNPTRLANEEGSSLGTLYLTLSL